MIPPPTIEQTRIPRPRRSWNPGDRVARIVLIERVQGSLWRCRCDCGRVKNIGTSNLHSGGTTSCGCSKRTARHTHMSEWGTWKDMRARCRNENVWCYRNYGGRGIKVCQRWEDSFEDFLADVGPRPSKLHTLDRIDNSGDYCPANCRWATWDIQASNRRSNVFVRAFGETKTKMEWSKDARCLVSPAGLHARLQKGIPPETAMSTPPHGVCK
jgi:hypothetical protein